MYGKKNTPPWRHHIDQNIPTEIAEKAARRLNTAARVLCARLRSESNRTQYSDFRRNAQKRFHAIIEYMHHCMIKRANLTIIRLDLHLDKETASIPLGCSRVPEHQLEEISRLRDEFSRHISRQFKTGLIGHLSKVEIGPERGLHIHQLIFLDAAIHQQDVNIAMALGETWRQKITKGRGNYFNCNAVKRIYRHLAIGKINTNSPDAIAGLRFIAAYFSLGELYAKAKFPKTFRSLCKGLPPKPANMHGGRPSSYKAGIDIRAFDIKEAIGQITFI